MDAQFPQDDLETRPGVFSIEPADTRATKWAERWYVGPLVAALTLGPFVLAWLAASYYFRL